MDHLFFPLKTQVKMDFPAFAGMTGVVAGMMAGLLVAALAGTVILANAGSILGFFSS